MVKLSVRATSEGSNTIGGNSTDDMMVVAMILGEGFLENDSPNRSVSTNIGKDT